RREHQTAEVVNEDSTARTTIRIPKRHITRCGTAHNIDRGSQSIALGSKCNSLAALGYGRCQLTVEHGHFAPERRDLLAQPTALVPGNECEHKKRYTRRRQPDDRCNPTFRTPGFPIDDVLQDAFSQVTRRLPRFRNPRHHSCKLRCVLHMLYAIRTLLLQVLLDFSSQLRLERAEHEEVVEFVHLGVCHKTAPSLMALRRRSRAERIQPFTVPNGSFRRFAI